MKTSLTKAVIDEFEVAITAAENKPLKLPEKVGGYSVREAWGLAQGAPVRDPNGLLWEYIDFGEKIAWVFFCYLGPDMDEYFQVGNPHELVSSMREALSAS